MDDIKTADPQTCVKCPEIVSDLHDIKRVLFGENEDGMVAAWQESRGAWKTIKWFGGVFGSLVVCGMVALFIHYVEAPYKYAKAEDLRCVVTQQAIISEKMSDMSREFNNLTNEIRNGKN